MNSNLQNALNEIANQYLTRNYDHLWLRTMLEQAAATGAPGSTLITGSSHALNAIEESCWNNAYNCSMHSQDLYYDFLCARRVLSAAEPGRFSRCFIVMGYYIAWQDLSLSKVSRETMIANVYYPIFGDAHHWEDPPQKDLWDWLEFDLPPDSPLTPEGIKVACEQVLAQKLVECGGYYSVLRPRKSQFDLKGQTWAQVSAGARLAMGKARAEEHNRMFRHKASFEENKRILQEFVRFLYEYEVQPVVVITPFTPEYNRFVQPEMRTGVEELLGSVPEDVFYVDFNQLEGIFEPEDFMDADHLSEQGAEKVSTLLAEEFGR